MSKKLTPWARIVRAGRRGTGVRLSAEDVYRLNGDGAIVLRGELDLDHNEAASEAEIEAEEVKP